MKRIIKILLSFVLACAMLTALPAEAKQKVIVINAGHQLHANLKKEAIGPGSSTKKYKVTAGATGYKTKVREAKTTLAVAKYLKTELEDRGYKVYMTHTKLDVNMSNKERALYGNKKKANLVISLHCDSTSSHSVKGATVLIPGTKNKYMKDSVISKSRSAGKKIIKSFCKKTGAKNRGSSSRNDLTGLNWSKVPAVYLEMGFISNKSEDAKLASKSYRKTCAKGIANGIDAYFK